MICTSPSNRKAPQNAGLFNTHHKQADYADLDHRSNPRPVYINRAIFSASLALKRFHD
jgi:hypothetical protein